MKLSDRLKAEHAFIIAKFGDDPICPRCSATLETFSDVCAADLCDQCPGFLAIDNAKAEFNRGYQAPRPQEKT